MKFHFYQLNQNFISKSFIFTTFFIFCTLNSFAQNCGGNIIRGCSGAGCFLDPDGDGDIVASATGFTDCGPFVDEMLEFEDLRNPAGCVSCQRPWVAIPAFNEQVGDLWAGGSSCGNTEIAPISTTDGTYAYYTIIDPDGTCNNGDELLIFRIRVGAAASGSFSYSLLIDTDNLLGGNDPDGVQCASKVANGGFEYEIIANPGNNKRIEVVDINGQVATGTVVASYDNDIYYNQADACRSACGCNSGDVYHTFAIELTAIGKSCLDKGFRFAGGTASSGNGTVSSNTSVSDVGGIGNMPSCPDTTVVCDCCEECTDVNSAFYCGGNMSSCLMACLNACVADENGTRTDLPVNFTSFNGHLNHNEIILNWTVDAELNNDYYAIEHSSDAALFQEIGSINGNGTYVGTLQYEFTDFSPQVGNNYYRLRQVDFDGTFSYSKTIVIEFTQEGFATVYPSVVSNQATITLNTSFGASAYISIVNTNGVAVKSFVRPITSGFNKIEFQIDELPMGVYFITVEFNGIRQLLKIIKGA